VTHKEPAVRGASLAALALRGDASCTTRLADALTIRSEHTQEIALKALVAVGDARAVPAVLRRLELDSPRDRGYFVSFIKLELGYLALHAAERPDAWTTARAITTKHWRRRTDPEQQWIRTYLPQVSPDGEGEIASPSPETMAEIRELILSPLRDDVETWRP